MYTIEMVAYDPASNEAPQKLQQKAHSMLDLGGTTVLFLLLAGFVAPMVLFVTRGYASAYAGSGIELRVLLWISGLAVILPLLQIFIHIRRYGGGAIRSNRDGYPVVEGLPARVARAHGNLVESLVPFGIVVIAAQILHVSNDWTVAASLLYLAGRLIHALTYMLGITVIRSSAFYAGAIATFVTLYQLPIF